MRAKTKSGIYFIQNLITENVYVGSSVDVYRRMKAHKIQLQNNRHGNIKLQRAFNKHGEENFQFFCIEKVTDLESLISREQYWIDYMKSCKEGYNCRPKAESNRGRIVSEETRKKLSKVNKGKAISEETRKKISKFHKGRIHSIVQNKKISEAKKGHKVSEETRKKISDKLKGRPVPKEVLERRPKIIVSEETRRKMSEAHKGKKPNRTYWALCGEWKIPKRKYCRKTEVT